MAVRRIVLILLVGMTLAPALLFLVGSALRSSPDSWRELQGIPFRRAAHHTSLLAAIGAAVCVLLSARLAVPMSTLPACVRRPLVGALCIPLLAPPFLSSLGISSFGTSLPYRYHRWFDGLSGSVHAMLCHLLPLTVLAVYFGARTMPTSQRDAMAVFLPNELAKRVVMKWVAPLVWWVTMVGLGYVLFDAGSAQIMGYHGVGSEVLIALAARYDWSLAGLKLGAATSAMLPLTIVFASRGGRAIRGPISGRNAAGPDGRRITQTSEWTHLPLLLILVAGLTVLPIWGLIRPVRAGSSAETLGYAWTVLRETAWPTVLSASLAASIATVLGFGFALLARRDAAARSVLLIAAMIMMTIPSAVTGVAWGRIVTALPSSLDFLLRSVAVVGVASGLKLWPIPCLLAMYAISRIPRSSDEAARLAGVPFLWRLTDVVLRPLLPFAALSAFAAAFLALADVGTLLMLQAPGETTFLGRLLAVLDNASQQTVAALCLVYFGVAAALAVPLAAFGNHLLRRGQSTA